MTAVPLPGAAEQPGNAQQAATIVLQAIRCNAGKAETVIRSPSRLALQQAGKMSPLPLVSGDVVCLGCKQTLIGETVVATMMAKQDKG